MSLDTITEAQREEVINEHIAFQIGIIRKERDKKLIASDWTQGADVPDSIKTPYATYRQQLRDLPASITLPKNRIEESDFPTEPSI